MPISVSFKFLHSLHPSDMFNSNDEKRGVFTDVDATIWLANQ